jgi:hypothetical protein
MAALEHARGRYPQSLRLYRASVPALRSLLGQDHPVVAQVAANLAKLRAHLGSLAGTTFQKNFRGI